MVLWEESFIILTAVFNQILYVNIPHGIQHAAVCCAKECENRSDFSIMRQSQINNGYLPVFYVETTNNTQCKLKLLFSDRTEFDTNWIKIAANTNEKENATRDIHISSIGSHDGNDIQKEITNIFILVCFVLTSLIVLILKILMKCIKKRINVI